MKPQFLHHNYRHILEQHRYFIFRIIRVPVFSKLRMINQILINEDRRALITYPKCTFFSNIAKGKKCRHLHYVVLPSEYLNRTELLTLYSYATCNTKIINVTRSRAGLPLQLPASRLVSQYCYVVMLTNPILM
jgi:hypothetical protein